MEPAPHFSGDEERLLHHETFMAEVMKLRAPKHASDEKPRWLQILESSAGTTLITVVVGGIVGNILVASYQVREKANEQTLAEYRQYLHKEEGIVRHAYEVLGTGYLNAHRTLDLTKFWFQEENYNEKDRPEIHAQRTAIIKERNDFLALWEKEREHIGFLLSYYHYGRPEVAAAWKNAVTALETLIVCSNEHYSRYLESEAKVESAEKAICRDDDATYSKALGALSDQITAARVYAWQQLGIPKPDEAP